MKNAMNAIDLHTTLTTQVVYASRKPFHFDCSLAA